MKVSGKRTIKTVKQVGLSKTTRVVTAQRRAGAGRRPAGTGNKTQVPAGRKRGTLYTGSAEARNGTAAPRKFRVFSGPGRP